MDPFVYDFCTFGLFFRLYMIFALFYEGSSGYLIVDFVSQRKYFVLRVKVG